MRHTVLFVVLGIVSFVACGGADSAAPDGDTGAGDDAGNGALTPPPSGDGGGVTSNGDAAAPTGTDGGAPATDGATTTPGKGITTIFTVLFENHDYAEIVGSSNAPYFNKLIGDYGLATSYHDSGVHPSLPNYLVLISGDPQYPGAVDLNPTTFPFPVKKPNLGSQLVAAKVPWRSYQESMGTPCKLTSKSPYAPKHDPFLYFDDIQNDPNGLCAATNVDYSELPADLTAGTYRYSFITPNLTDDGHDGKPGPALATSDAWAAVEIEKIKASPAYQNGGVIFITWDEAEGRSGPGSYSQVPMIVVSEQIKSKGFKSNTNYTHKSYLATVEDILGVPRLDTVKNEPNMMEFFK